MTRAAGLPLSALLSYAYVAFTIEFDNEFEHRSPHGTTRHGATAAPGPWLTSLVMYSNCMRFVTDEGVTARELERLARTHTNLNGMERWRYVTVQPDPKDPRPKPPPSSWLIRPTPRGRMARKVWRPLFDEIEQRWHARFGADEIAKLRASLQAVVNQIGLDLPDCLPILGYGLFSRGPDEAQRASSQRENDIGSLSLIALLSRVLLAFAIEFEHESELSLAISANVVRVLDEVGVPERNLPLLSGVSKEAINMALGILQKQRIATVQPAPRARGKVVRLTAKGIEAQEAYARRVSTIEKRWQERFGKETIRSLRERLERLTGEPAETSPLFRGLEPYPDGWRASVPKPATLPHFPMVLHRGGYPDGS